MTYALAVVVALVLVLPSDQWWRWGRPHPGGGEPANPSDVASLPILTPAQVFGNYLGGARYPNTQSNGTDFKNSSEGVLAYVDGDSLYANGGGKVTELSIPTLVNTSNPSLMPFMTYVQGFMDITEGNGAVDIETGGGDASQGWRVGGLLLFGGALHGNAYIYYDASNTQTVTAFKHSPTLATTGIYAGMVKVWNGTGLPAGNRQGLVSGYMAHVPSEWQTALGGPAVIGQCCIPIVSRTSNCPALFTFNPADIYVAAEPINANALMWCANGHDTWGAWSGATPLWGASATIRGVAIIKNTRTTIYLGTNGIGNPPGTFCYGAVPVPCTDTEDPASGNHAWPYRYQYWFVDTLQLAEVKAGTRSPWNVLPYAYGELVLPTTNRTKTQGLGMMYDEPNKKLYFAQARAHTVVEFGELGYPILHGWQLP